MCKNLNLTSGSSRAVIFQTICLIRVWGRGSKIWVPFLGHLTQDGGRRWVCSEESNGGLSSECVRAIELKGSSIIMSSLLPGTGGYVHTGELSQFKTVFQMPQIQFAKRVGQSLNTLASIYRASPMCQQDEYLLSTWRYLEIQEQSRQSPLDMEPIFWGWNTP